MADEVNFDTQAPKPAKKKAKPKKKAGPRVPAAAKASEPFPGLTRTACAAGCSEKGCVISQRLYCAHPTKGGLQSADQGDRAALQRVQQARDQINVRIDPDRFK